MDLASFIAWSVAISGGIFAAFFGLKRAQSGAPNGWVEAIGIAVALGIFLTFVQVYLNDLCIKQLKLCVSRGEENMSFWFQSFFAIPVYWLIAGLSWQILKKEKLNQSLEARPGKRSSL